MKIKSIIIAVSIFTFFTPVFVWAGCSDANIYGSWIVSGEKLNGNEWDPFFEVISFLEEHKSIRIGRCNKFLRGCSILHCKKSKKDIYNRLIALGKKGLKDAGILTPNYKVSSKGMCLTSRGFTVSPYGPFGGSKEIEPGSWGLPKCVPVP